MNAFSICCILCLVHLKVSASGSGGSTLTWKVEVENSNVNSTDLLLGIYSKMENILKVNFAVLSKRLDKAEKQIAELENTAKYLREENKELVKKVYTNNQDLNTTIAKQQNTISSNSDRIGKVWVSGSYCFLANGNCPAGFTRYSGYMRAISLHAANTNYITPVTFGSSNIRCHGTCGAHGNWIGELNLAVCCK